jgi:Flp pilus assembly CpaE family ATPase
LPSVKSAKMFLDLAPDLGLKPDQITLVINRATMVGAIPSLQIEKALKVPRMFQVPDDPKLRLSLIKGVTIFQLDENAPSAQAIKQLAEAVWDRQVAAAANPAPGKATSPLKERERV